MVMSIKAQLPKPVEEEKGVEERKAIAEDTFIDESPRYDKAVCLLPTTSVKNKPPKTDAGYTTVILDHTPIQFEYTDLQGKTNRVNLRAAKRIQRDVDGKEWSMIISPTAVWVASNILPGYSTMIYYRHDYTCTTIKLIAAMKWLTMQGIDHDLKDDLVETISAARSCEPSTWVEHTNAYAPVSIYRKNGSSPAYLGVVHYSVIFGEYWMQRRLKLYSLATLKDVTAAVLSTDAHALPKAAQCTEALREWWTARKDLRLHHLLFRLLPSDATWPFETDEFMQNELWRSSAAKYEICRCANDLTERLRIAS